MNKFKINLLILTVFVLAILGLSACSSGGNESHQNEQGDDDSGHSATSISFTSDSGAGTGNIWLEIDSTNPESKSFKLKVVGDGLAVYGVAGRLEFDRSICTLDGAQAGTALEGNSAKIVAKAGSNDKGGVFGFSRSVEFMHSAQLSKDKAIGTLEFTVSKTGTTKIAFVEDRSKALDQELKSVDVVKWLGGTLVVK